MKSRHILSILFSFIVVSFHLYSCTEEAKPEDTINKLETAFNEYNIEMMLECYEPSFQAVYEGGAELFGAALGGIDVKTLMQGLGGFVNIFGDSLIEGGLPEIDIIINSIEEVTEDKVLAKLTLKYIYSEEMKKQLPSYVQTEEQMNAYLVLIDGTWYISSEIPIL